MQTLGTPSWPTPPQLDSEQAAAMAAYERLSTAERQRVARLVSMTGAPLHLAISAIKATRP